MIKHFSPFEPFGPFPPGVPMFPRRQEHVLNNIRHYPDFEDASTSTFCLRSLEVDFVFSPC